MYMQFIGKQIRQVEFLRTIMASRCFIYYPYLMAFLRIRSAWNM